MQQTINRSRFTQVPQGTHVIEILDDEEEKILMNDDELDAIKQELIAKAIFTKNLDEMKKAIFYCCARKTVGDKKAFEKTMNLKYIRYFKQKLNIDISKEFYKGRTEVDDKSSQPDSHHIVLYGADFLTTKNLQTKFKGFHDVQIKWINASNVSIKFNPEQNVQNLLSIQRKNDQKTNKNQIVEQIVENNPFKWIPLKKYEVLGFQRPLWYRHSSMTEKVFPEEHFDGKKFQRAKITIQESELFITCDKDKEFYDKNIILFEQSLYSNRKYRKSLKGSQNGQRNNRQRTRDFRNKGGNQDFQQRKNDDELGHRYDRRHSNFRNDNNFYPYENDRHNKRQEFRGNRNRTYSDTNQKRNQEKGSFTQRKNEGRGDFNNRRDNFNNTRNNFSNRYDNHDRINNFSRTNYGSQSNNRDNGGRQNNFMNEPKNVQKSMEIEDKSFQFLRRSISKSRSNSSKSLERHPNPNLSLLNQENDVSLSFAINPNAAIDILNNTQNQEVTVSFINHSNSLNRKEEEEQSEKSEDLQNLLSKLEQNKKHLLSLNNKSRSNSSRSNSVKGKKVERKNSSVQKQKSFGSNLNKARGNRYNSSEEKKNNQNDQNRCHNNQFYSTVNDSNRTGNYNRGKDNNYGSRDFNNYGRQYNNNERQSNNYGDRQFNYRDRNYNNQNSDSRGNPNINTERNNNEESNTSNRGRGSYIDRGRRNYQNRNRDDNQNNRDNNSNNRDFRSNDNNYSRGFGGNRQDLPRKDRNTDEGYQNQPSRGYESNRKNFPSNQSNAFKKPPADIEHEIQY